MLPLEPRTPRLSRKERAWVDLFNAVHSPGAFLLGVDLAAVLDRRPSSLPPVREGQRYAALSWPGRRQPYLVPMEELLKSKGRRLKSLLGGLHKEDVALATPQLPGELWQFLHERGYYREVAPRQCEGWLSDTEQEARWYLGERPDLEASVALLPPEGREGIVGEECLLLIQISYRWFVLSELGAHGRAGGPELLRGEEAWLTTCRPQWAGYKVHLVRQVGASEVGHRWGAAARERTREDVPALVVKAEPWGPGVGA